MLQSLQAEVTAPLGQLTNKANMLQISKYPFLCKFTSRTLHLVVEFLSDPRYSGRVNDKSHLVMSRVAFEILTTISSGKVENLAVLGLVAE